MTTTVYDPASKASTTTPSTALAAPTQASIVRMSMDTVAGFEALQRAARLLTASSLVPERYRGAEGLPNAVIALEMAGRIGASPLMAMQHLYVVHGSPAWSSQFLIASVNSSGRFSALRYEKRGTPGKDDFAVRAWAIETATGERLDGTWITWDMVKKEGWASKSGSKWLSMPEQMGMYRAASFWQRAYAPEVSMGIRTVEEVEDTVIDVTPEKPTTAEVLTQAADVAAKEAPAKAGPKSVKERLEKLRKETQAEDSDVQSLSFKVEDYQDQAGEPTP